MNLLSPKIIKELLKKYSAAPSKYLGQNFLIDGTALHKIIEAAQLSQKDTVLEIGPGIGTLTQALASHAKNVIAIEKDAAMVEILKETCRDFNNIEIATGNILKLDPKPYTLDAIPHKVVANIPYYLTSPLIRMLLESDNPPTEIVLMVQKEVAQRICAQPPDMSLLAVSVQFYANPKIISYVSKNCFWPAPKVDSAIIKITPDSSRRPTSTESAEAFFKIVKAGFLSPRKQLVNNLSVGLKKDKKEITEWLLEKGINPKQRAETLSVADWQRLVNKGY